MKKRMFTYLMLVWFPFLLLAQWSNDPSLNTEIMDTIGEQVLPKVVVNPDNGESYISWFSKFDGVNYDIYMQRLDVNGNKLWGENGLLISYHMATDWVTDYDLVIDNDRCAVLVAQDNKTGIGNICAYRMSPEGEFLWGDDGIILTDDNDIGYSPKAIVDQDGNIVFAWEVLPGDTTQFRKIHLQKLSPGGQLLWDDNVIISTDSMHCVMPYILPSEDNSTIIVWVESGIPDTSGSWLYMYPYAQKIDSDGNFAWQSKVAIDTLDNMPLKAFFPSMVSDGNSGFFVGWWAIFGPHYTSYVQHVNSEGVAQWTPNGVNVSDLILYEHAGPVLTYLPQNDELFVFWNELREYSATDAQCAIFGQKFSNTGERLWTDEGEMFDGWYSPTDTLTKITGISPVTDNDFTLFFYTKHKVLTLNRIAIHAMRINHEGDFVWDNEKPIISSANSYKLFEDFSKLFYNQWIVVWADNRNNLQIEEETGIYAQNISIDGIIGPTGIKENNKFTANTLINYPNPFRNSTTIEYKITETCNVNISLFDNQGHYVRNIFNENKTPGTYTLLFNGNDLSPGIYLYKIKTDNYVGYNKMVIMK